AQVEEELRNTLAHDEPSLGSELERSSEESWGATPLASEAESSFASEPSPSEEPPSSDRRRFARLDDEETRAAVEAEIQARLEEEQRARREESDRATEQERLRLEAEERARVEALEA